MKSAVQYKVQRLLKHTGDGKLADVLVRGDNRFWRVRSASLIEAHSLELDVYDGRQLIVAPEDIIAVTLTAISEAEGGSVR